jgi:hypothetical protein
MICNQLNILNQLKDCNGDGVVNCEDYARIHKSGGYSCQQPIEGTEYYKKFSTCKNLLQLAWFHSPSILWNAADWNNGVLVTAWEVNISPSGPVTQTETIILESSWIRIVLLICELLPLVNCQWILKNDNQTPFQTTDVVHFILSISSHQKGGVRNCSIAWDFVVAKRLLQFLCWYWPKNWWKKKKRRPLARKI